MLKKLELNFFQPTHKMSIKHNYLINYSLLVNSLNLEYKTSFSRIITNFFAKYFVPIKFAIKPVLSTTAYPQRIFSRYFYNGLGYKVFLRLNHLFIWIGLTHYTIIKIPFGIKVFTKKKRFFIVGFNKIKFNDFLMKIRKIKKIDLYKGKGLLEVKTYKGFIRMKSGKKKQY